MRNIVMIINNKFFVLFYIKQNRGFVLLLCSCAM
jgi:hypothetical protein